MAFFASPDGGQTSVSGFSWPGKSSPPRKDFSSIFSFVVQVQYVGVKFFSVNDENNEGVTSYIHVKNS